MGNKNSFAWIVIGLAVTVSACAPSLTDEPDATPAPPVSEVVPVPDVPETTQPGGSVPRTEIERILEDGVVTYAEYESAVNAVVQCMRDEGWRVRGPVWTDDRVMLMYVVTGTGTDNDPGLERRTEYCNESHIGEVWSVFREQHPLAPEIRREREAELASCLKDYADLDPALIEDGAYLSGVRRELDAPCPIVNRIMIPPELLN